MSHQILILSFFFHNNLESVMDKLIERAVGTNTRCYTCGGLVYAVEKKQTTNHVN